MSAEPCIFCRIVAGQIPATVVASNPHAIAFRDLHPQAPVHLLVIPRQHVSALSEPLPDDALVGLLALVRDVAAAEGLDAAGYRVVTNVGNDGGQTVHHLHFHVLGGRQMHWPPG